MITYKEVSTEEMFRLCSLDINMNDLADSLYENSCFPYFNEGMIQYRSYLLALEGEKIIGICCYKIHNDEKKIGIGYITVHKNYRHQGIGKTLFECMFQIMKQSKYCKYILNIGDFTIQGEKYLRHIWIRLQKDIRFNMIKTISY